MQEVSPTGTTNYIYDRANVIEEVDGIGTVLARYSQGPGVDQPLSDVVGGVAKYYDADGLGSITSLADISGSLTDTYVTDSFGKTTASTGTTRNPYRYTARDLDSETGLMYYRARYYDVQVGRFISEDPIQFKGGANFYAYVRNNPISNTDPRGLDCESCPSGRWSGTGANWGGMIFVGAYSGVYKVSCWGRNLSCWIKVTCYGSGFGLGGSVSLESIWIWGAYSSAGLEGHNYGSAIGGGGVGIVATGGSIAPGGSQPGRGGQAKKPSSTSATYGGGVGLGGGVIFGDCQTSVLRCSQ